MHDKGLKVHASRKHKLACEFCDRKFEEKKEFLEKHLKVEKGVRNIEEKRNEELGMEIKIYRADEACLVVSSESNPRDDDLPVLFLHCCDCWNKSVKSCPDFPKLDLDADENENIILNHEYYDPTVHAMLEWVIVGDYNTEGCYPDWSKLEQMIKKNLGTN